MNKTPTAGNLTWFKYFIFAVLALFAISSQNLLPVHIAFIPIVVPPLLSIFNRLKIDRRAVACVLTFGLTATYMLLPVGFGKIFIESILVKNINQAGATFRFTNKCSTSFFSNVVTCYWNDFRLTHSHIYYLP